ncbi:MAG: ANTAR domain-containing protein [Mycobacterium sp.]|uniref:ANTAR domain-containing protein n=1 Tax=Mycobacterium sp. TaxID=1785 RepID=UPI00262BAD5E|nr:ANTAR domain-containing protein [Mycobacterium sp.]MDI3314878.1 ANTAR domain-containing protein [Mycobacterium sp.]
MPDERRPREARWVGARILDTAEGVLIALRRCRLDEAFVDIMQTAKRHNVNAVELAGALVSIAESQHGKNLDDPAVAAALTAWGHLFGASARDRAPAEALPGENA